MFGASQHMRVVRCIFQLSGLRALRGVNVMMCELAFEALNLDFDDCSIGGGPT